MITDAQIAAVVRLPATCDFRFKREYGETVVVVEVEGGQLSIHEDGSRFFVSRDGASALFWASEEVVLMEKTSDGADH